MPKKEVAPPVSKFHFLTSLDTAGSALRSALSNAYYGLIGDLIQKEIKDTTQTSKIETAHLFLMDCINLDSSADDLQALNKIGIVPFLTQNLYEHLVMFCGFNPQLRPLLEKLDSASKGNAQLRRRQFNSRNAAWGLMRLITYLSALHAQNGSEGAAELTQSILNVVQKQLQVLLDIRSVQPEKDEKKPKNTDEKQVKKIEKIENKLASREDFYWQEEPESLAWINNLGAVYYYESDFDVYGILYALGSDSGISDYRSPVDKGAVKVSASSIAADAKELNSVVGREPAMFCTQGNEKAGADWVCFDFKEQKVLTTSYTLRHYNKTGNVLRNWKLEGSLDGKEWELVDERTEDDHIVDKAGATASFFLARPVRKVFNQLRIVVTGKNSSGNHKLCLSGCEFYGCLNPTSDGGSTISDWWDKTCPPGKWIFTPGDESDDPEKALVVEHKGYDWNSVKGVNPFNEGQVYFEVKVDTWNRSEYESWGICIGVVPENYSTMSGAQCKCFLFGFPPSF
jgi:hypothetical protein